MSTLRVIALALCVLIGVGMAVVLTGVAVHYGEIEPCRILAIDLAEDAAGTDDQATDQDDLIAWYRYQTSFLSMGECGTRLLDRWGEKLAGP